MTGLPTCHCEGCKDRWLRWVLAHPDAGREAMDAERCIIEATCQGQSAAMVAKLFREHFGPGARR